MKVSADVETMAPATLAAYARFCAETLARAHARSGDPVAIAAYLGKKDGFDQSIADFSQRYADQNEQDYRLLRGHPLGPPARPRRRLNVTQQGHSALAQTLASSASVPRRG